MVRTLLRGALGGIFSIALMAPAFVASAAPAPANFTVQAGAATRDASVLAMLFEPSSITIDAGDSVTWNVSVAHTVTFGSPPPGPPNLGPVGGTSYDGSSLTSSGLLTQGQSYKLTFPKAGTYSYRCVIHPASMTGTVVVQAAGAAYPVAPESYTAADNPAFAPALQAGQTAFSAAAPSRAASGNGATAWVLQAGLGDGKSYSVERFVGNGLTIHTGDTVTWRQPDPNESHTVTFLSGGPDPEDNLPNGQPNPQVVGPVGGHNYDGTGYLNSGYMQAGMSYSLTFTRAGTYQYRCLIHDQIGMLGSINVVAAASTATQLPSSPAQVPATVPAAMPNTGRGGANAVSGGLLLLGLLFIGLGGGLLLTRRAD